MMVEAGLRYGQQLHRIGHRLRAYRKSHASTNVIDESLTPSKPLAILAITYCKGFAGPEDTYRLCSHIIIVEICVQVVTFAVLVH